MRLSRSLAVAVFAAAIAGTTKVTTAAAQDRTLGFDKSGLGTTARAQDDFYQYVNAAWLAAHPIPADKANIGTFGVLADKSEEILHEILDAAAADTKAPAGSIRRKLGDYYVTWMDSAAIERAGLAPVQPLLDRIAALKGKWELPSLYAVLQRAGVGRPFNANVGTDDKDATRHIVDISQSGLGMPGRDYYLREGDRFQKARDGYVAYVTTLLRVAKDPDPAAGAAQVFAIEKALAEKHWEPARNRDPNATYNPRTVTQLDSMTPGFSWQAYFDAAGFAKSPAFNVSQPDVLAAQNQLVQGAPIEVIRRWFTMRVLDSFASSLNAELRDANFTFRSRVLSGTEVERDRWKRGVANTQGAMGDALGQLYAERTFSTADRERALTLVRTMLAAFDGAIDSLDWMSPVTRQAAKAKLAKFTVKIGYPDKWRDYSKLEVRRGDYAGNVLRSRAFAFEYRTSRLGGPVERREWGMMPQTVNASYNPSMNDITFPAAILQPPFFDPKADDATNYGSIGGVIGHEISHGFDDQGSQYDGAGNLRNWWTPEDRKAFEARTKMLGAQYDALSPVPGLNVNGKLTMGENIGDLSGLAVAYKAWKRSLAGKPSPVIDGITGDQRFFIGWAQGWRQNIREGSARQRVLTDPHAPNEFRTNQIVRNFAEFYAAFGVTANDKMWLAPQDRVKIW